MFSEIHAFFTKVVDEVSTKAEADLAAFKADFGTNLRAGFKTAEKDIVDQILSGPSASGDAQHVAADVLALAEQAIQKILVAHGL